VRIVGRDYPGTLDDVDVLAIAHREGRVLVTNDRDFGRLVFEESRPHVGVILLRLGTSSLATMIARLDHVLTAHGNDLGRFIVVTPRVVRVR
jgi:predicted nuclease of predicted toxin-antitoxin system